MKKILLTTLCLIGFLGFQDVLAQETEKNNEPNFPKLDTSPMDMIIHRDQGDAVVMRVIYSRPQTRDREIFGKLVPYGEVWRTGANEATEITFYKDMEIGGEVVKAGTYSLYTIPDEKEWTVILNQSTHTWGAYEYTDEEDYVRITVPVRNSSKKIENFSMAIEQKEDEAGANLLMGWADKYIKVPFSPAG
ncbi:DUF2911 domain-containing protein [Salegentibacter sp. LM13S]|uniref:DUF2911 domain-containing protein n=1 Tax=Salegentibacter lacus TaxID=2873599 RepID=UPI001CCDAC5D|nr:DUF2911 domain-containing protein [Salegentibacter lacus]MBZ9629283.1 DUF2911 domain-containing protein [Salegentibacter lacus]